MGARFWANQDGGEKDSFGHVRSKVGNEIFQQEDDAVEAHDENGDGGNDTVVDRGHDDNVPPLLDAVSIKDDPISTLVGEKEDGLDGENVFLEVD